MATPLDSNRVSVLNDYLKALPEGASHHVIQGIVFVGYKNKNYAFTLDVEKAEKWNGCCFWVTSVQELLNHIEP